MSQAGSLVGAFDLNSQAGVMAVLAAIRASALPAQAKNELRDLVFHYTKGGGDASVRIDLEQKLAALQIIPVATKSSAPTGPALAFGSYRPTPTFKAPIVDSVSATSPVNTPTQIPVPVQSTAPVTFAQPLPVTQNYPTPSVVVALPVVPPPVIEPLVIPVSPVLQPSPTQPVQPVPEPQAIVPQPVEINVAPAAEINYLERIRQIKAAVNSKVGNPVNLVDIDNAVGREYMNALLEAMKKLSTGAVSEMGPSMQRLESAYSAVEVAIVNHGTKIVAAPVVSPVATAAQSVLAEVMPEITDLPPLSSLPTRPLAEIEQAVQPTPEPVLPMAETLVAPQPPQPPQPSLPIRNESDESGFEKKDYQNQVPQAPSLASQQRILTPNDLPDAATLSTGSAGDTLATKEVDDGLDQLLSDWSIFKKSGIFGTGPKGSEHPLFKKIAGLAIPLILAGRFEGSTQEIRQSITDYMNGWRYEQGIIYQPGESFDHYLRRVIRHIIDLQKKHGQA